MKTKLVIFGITGDLGHRKLIPALQRIHQSGNFPELSIIGVSRHEVDVPALMKEVTGTSELADITQVFTMDLSVSEDYGRLKIHLNLQSDEQVLIYLAVPPSAAATIVDFLGQAGLNTPNTKLLFEKPFGFDTASAIDFIKRTGRYFTDKQIYRIDHYMAKEVAAEVIKLRLNAIDGRYQWGNESVAAVDIIATETIGIEGRALFYEGTGALRDFVQGHLMQLLSLVLMDLSPPCTIDDLSRRRLEALAKLQLADPDKTKRAQYEGYQEEVSNPGSLIETFVSVALSSSDEKWVGVPLRLITGKGLDKKRSAVVIRYKDGTEDTFEEEKIVSTNAQLPGAYERVLVEAIRGRKHIFTTGPEVVRSWEILAPIQKDWSMNHAPLSLYEPGSSVEALLSHHM